MDVNKKTMKNQGREGEAEGGTNRGERRKSSDFWARLFILVNYGAWAGLMVFLLVFHRAQPEFETFFDRFYELNLRTYWDKTFIRYLVYIAGTGLAASAGGFCLALFRARRRTDHRKSIVVLGVLYLVLIILSWLLL